MTSDLPGVATDGYVEPAYGGRCVADVPGTVAATLGASHDRRLPERAIPSGSYDRVVTVLLDGVGLERYRERRDATPLFRALAEAGRETPITSVYPSETAAAITTLHTGRTPAEHGLLGWNLHLPEADLTCQSLPFLTRSADDGETIDLREATDGVTGRDLFDGGSVYERLDAAGITGEVVIPSRITGPHGDVATAGAGVEGVGTVAEWALRLRRRLAATRAPSYHYAYWPDVDGASHDEGTRSALYEAELAAATRALERELTRVDRETAAETLLVLTADHGHHDADPAAAVDLSDYPGVWDRLATHDDGRRVLPTGGPRNLHLHVADGHREAVRNALADAPFEARVLSGERAIASGLFGTGEVSPKLRARTGDLVVVPKRVNVWFAAEGSKLAFVGTHGGQHPREMRVPFVAAPLDAVQNAL